MNENKKGTIHSITQCAVFSALLCICSPISVPIGPVSVTLSLFAVMLAGILLDYKKAVASVAVYILLGACGVPVFSNGLGGISRLVGPTGGYIWSYLITVLIISLISNLPVKNKYITYPVSFLSCIIGTAICYALGTFQFMAVTDGYNLGSALAVCVYPFIVFDIIKAVCATVLGIQIKEALKKSKIA